MITAFGAVMALLFATAMFLCWIAPPIIEGATLIEEDR